MTILFKSLLFVCALSVVSVAHGEWSSDVARKVVTELMDSLEELVTYADDTGSQSDAVKNKFSHAAMVDLRLLVEEVDRLDLELAAGRGKAQTYAQYQRISNLRYSIRDYAKDIEIPDEVRKKADTAGKLLRKLDIMYIE